jgi:hypothetical protein
MTNVTKIRPVGAALIHADLQTDMVKAIAGFRNDDNVPKSVIIIINY